MNTDSTNTSTTSSSTNINISKHSTTTTSNNENNETKNLTFIANSISSLAQAVKNLQFQMKKLDDRMTLQETKQQQQQQQQQQQEQQVKENKDSKSEHNDNNDMKKKKQDFIQAYKTVVSLVKTLKMIPELNHYLQSCGTGTVAGTTSTRTPTTNMNMIRNIALTFSDNDTVGSFISHDDQERV